MGNCAMHTNITKYTMHREHLVNREGSSFQNGGHQATLTDLNLICTYQRLNVSETDQETGNREPPTNSTLAFAFQVVNSSSICCAYKRALHIELNLFQPLQFFLHLQTWCVRCTGFKSLFGMLPQSVLC